MDIRVRLFAGARDLAGQEYVELALASVSTVADLRQALQTEIPALSTLMPHALFAIDADYATDETVIPADAEIACIPPVSGG